MACNRRVKQFKLSTDPRFVDKLRDIVGLYVDPPAHAVVLPLHAPSASWLNAVEGFFAKLTKRRLRRGTLLSVVDLQAAINRFVIEHNAEPKPFTWTTDPDKIIQAVKRGHQVLDFFY
jgi:hypothetical protein